MEKSQEVVMQRMINPAEVHTISIESTQEERAEMEQRYGIDEIRFVRGNFTIRKDNTVVSCYLLEGTIEATVIDQGEELMIAESLKLYLVNDEADIEKFPLEDDVEVVEEGQVDIGDIVGQYVYLAVMEIE